MFIVPGSLKFAHFSFPVFQESSRLATSLLLPMSQAVSYPPLLSSSKKGEYIIFLSNWEQAKLIWRKGTLNPCLIIETKFGLSHPRFVAWNPAVGEDCEFHPLQSVSCVLKSERGNEIS